MAEFPAMPLWTDAYLADTECWTPYGGIAERHVDWSKHPSRLLNASWREIREAVLAAHDGGCVFCGVEDAPLEVDHIIPRCKGGTHAWDNLQVLCRSCNRSKGGRL